MKNILAENMKRFRTKNLTESQREKLDEIQQLNEVDFIRDLPGPDWANKQPETKQLTQTIQKQPNHLTGYSVIGPYVLKWDPGAYKRNTGREWRTGDAHTAQIIGFVPDTGGDSSVPRVNDPQAEYAIGYLESTGWKNFAPIAKRSNTGPEAVNNAYATPPSPEVYAAYKNYLNLVNPRLKQTFATSLGQMFPNGKDAGTNAGVTGRARKFLQKMAAMTSQTPG